ncbi:amidohydrolase family protein [Roseomonas sp. HJA6]|uniref:Amidohydrolase family protein n=1 Tax=Roseomonas alba TaxID=2846776 RepID=A0ABS7AB31_9PROT|nr:amidohydrolase family protein [Neoroseomonas alba]MBW6399285.1 amidohydrolase family protein [Neoroseomonas alba]
MIPVCKAADRATQPPSWPLCPGGLDSHAHVFGPVARFAYAANRRYTPPEQTVEDYLHLLDALGLRYGVLVQPSVYAEDNACLVDALKQARGRLLGVVDIDVLRADADTLASMTLDGVCGLRLWWGESSNAEHLRQVGEKVRDLGWHLDIIVAQAALLPCLAPLLRNLALPTVIEAMGCPVEAESPDSPGFRALLDLLRDGAAMVKLSHPYRIDRTGLPYDAAAPFAAAIIAAAPERCVWGSDWPHPNIRGPMPEDGALLELLPHWAGGRIDLAQRILSDNAYAFYGRWLRADPTGRI